jgi:hypothetical protein
MLLVYRIAVKYFPALKYRKPAPSLILGRSS